MVAALPTLLERERDGRGGGLRLLVLLVRLLILVLLLIHVHCLGGHLRCGRGGADSEGARTRPKGGYTADEANFRKGRRQIRTD